MNITEIRVKLTMDPRNKLKGYCSVTLDDAFVVRDLKIIEGAKGPFVAMPSRKLSDRCPHCAAKNCLTANYCNQCGHKLDPERAMKDSRGRAIVRLHGDLKRHDMGRDLAESIDEARTGASTFLTENLWGCGSTAPYLHDGRATTLTEAILAHGGEARAARDAFASLPHPAQTAVIAFLDDMVLYRLPEEEEEE